MALQLLHGDIEQLRREYMVLFTRGVSITRKLGFSDVIMPGRTSINKLICTGIMVPSSFSGITFLQYVQELPQSCGFVIDTIINCLSYFSTTSLLFSFFDGGLAFYFLHIASEYKIKALLRYLCGC